MYNSIQFRKTVPNQIFAFRLSTRSIDLCLPVDVIHTNYLPLRESSEIVMKHDDYILQERTTHCCLVVQI